MSGLTSEEREIERLRAVCEDWAAKYETWRVACLAAEARAEAAEAKVARVEVLAEQVWDSLDAAHDRAWHIHASECCWSFPGAVDAIASALRTSEEGGKSHD